MNKNAKFGNIAKLRSKRKYPSVRPAGRQTGTTQQQHINKSRRNATLVEIDN